MQIIIIGCGKVGSTLAEELIEQGHDVVIIDSDMLAMGNADHLDCIKIIGVPIDREILREGGIETADVLFAVTQIDNINIMVAQIAKEIYKVPRIVARIFNPISREIFETFGIDTVSQTDLTVQALIRRLAGEERELSCRMFNTGIIYSAIPVEEDLIGDDINTLSTDTGKIIIGVLRGEKLTLTHPGMKLRANDQLVLLGTED